MPALRMAGSATALPRGYPGRLPRDEAVALAAPHRWMRPMIALSSSRLESPVFAELTIDRARPADREQILGVLVRGMRDNPLHIAAFGADAATRELRIRHMFELAFRRPGFLDHALVARLPGGGVIGVCGVLAPGACVPSATEQVKLLPGLLGLGAGNAGRVMRWMGAWSRHDPKTRHWHVGPVAVDAPLQGLGIGSAMLHELCRRLDVAGEEAYLETDKEANVRFYRKAGFEVVAEAKVLGTPNWFMRRSPVR